MKVLFAANDPGGANAIAPVVLMLKENGNVVRGYVTGPARDIFSARGISYQDAEGISNDLLPNILSQESFGVFLFGTSIGDTIEKKILVQVRDHASIAVVDFWANYRLRFSTPGTDDLKLLPTKVCVIDELMRTEMIAEQFPEDCLIVTGNPHFDHFADSITRKTVDPYRILFISQPLRDISSLANLPKLPFDEHRVLNDVISALHTLPGEYTLSIRLHPKEDTHTFDTVLSSRVSIAQESTLEAALSSSGFVIGMNSPVLIQSAAANIPTISYEPGMNGPDPLASNRAGVTRRVMDPQELAATLFAYAAGTVDIKTRAVRSVWPVGATSRVCDQVLALIEKS